MDVIMCGWCGHPASGERCDYCGRNPYVPWEHRDLQPPAADVADSPGRPVLEAAEVRQLYQDARAAVISDGRTPTVEAIAERLDRSPRTVRAWRQRFDLE